MKLLYDDFKEDVTHYKSQLESAGRDDYLKYLKTDGDLKIKAQIIDLFSSIFKNG